MLALALVAAGLAVWQARRQASADTGTTMATSVTAAGSGAVGGRDVLITGGVGPTAGRDATSIVGGAEADRRADRQHLPGTIR